MDESFVSCGMRVLVLCTVCSMLCVIYRFSNTRSPFLSSPLLSSPLLVFPPGADWWLDVGPDRRWPAMPGNVHGADGLERWPAGVGGQTGEIIGCLEL